MWNKSRPIAQFAFLLCIITLFFIFLSPSAHAATANGHLYGHLLDGSKKGAPIAGQHVTLQMAQGSNASDLSSATTDAHGAFSFANLSTDKSISYAIYTLYQGAQYTSNVVALDSKPTQQVNLTVYEATTSMANIAVVQATILFYSPDASTGSIHVSELFIFRNLGTYTYVGSLVATTGMPNALRFSLPQTASNVALGKGFEGYQAIQVDRGFASDAAILPGDSQFSFTFDIPYSASFYDFDYQAIYPTVRLSILVPTAIHATSSGLNAQGVVNTNQQAYSLFVARALLSNQDVHLQLQGLPAITPAPTTSDNRFNPSPLWLLIALLIMAIILFVTWTITRSMSRPKRKQKGLRSQEQRTIVKGVNVNVGADSSRPRMGPAPDTHVKTPREKTLNAKQQNERETLLQALLDLDTSYESGNVDKAEYEEQRTNLKTQLRNVISENAAAGRRVRP